MPSPPPPSGRSRRVVVLLLFVFALAIGMAVRWIGIRHGAPDLVYHPDVAKQTLVARAIFHDNLDIRGVFKDDVKRTLYPYGMSALLGRGWRWYAAVSGDDQVDQVHRWVWALRMRYLAAGLFLATSALALLLAGSRWRPWTFMVVSLLLWLEPVNAQFSHYGMNDVPLVGMLLLAWSLAGWMRREPPRAPWASLLCGLTLGLAFGIKYQALLGLIFPATTWLLLLRVRSWRWATVSAVAMGAAWCVGVLFSCPMLVMDPGYFVSRFPEFMAWQGNIMGEAIPLGPKAARNAAAIIRSFLDPAHAGLLLLALAGGVAMWRESDLSKKRLMRTWHRHPCLCPPGKARARMPMPRLLRRFLDSNGREWQGPPKRVFPVASALLFCSILLCGMLLGRDFVRANDLLPVFAFLALASAPALSYAWVPWRSVRIGIRVVAVLAITGFGTTAFLDSAALARPDTRERARAWGREQMTKDARVLRERYMLPVGRPDLKEAGYRYLSSSEARKEIDRGAFEYVISSSLAHDRFSDPLSAYHDPEAAAFYAALATNLPVRARFEDRQMFYAHPIIIIYGAQVDSVGPQTPLQDHAIRSDERLDSARWMTNE